MTHSEYLKDPKSEVYKELKPLIRLSIGLEEKVALVDDVQHALGG